MEPTKKEMGEILLRVEQFPDHYCLPSQKAMVDRFRYFLGLTDELNLELHSTSQIAMYKERREKQT